VVCHIACSCGQVYIEEIGPKEHRDACKRGMMEKLAVTEHAWENHHPIHWEETSVLDKARSQGETTYCCAFIIVL